MAKVNAANYGGNSAAKLTPDDLDGLNAAVLTIQSAEEGRIPDRYAPGGARPVMRVYFREFPEHVYYMNPAGVTACIEEFGDDTDDWQGNQIPLVVKETENPATGRKVLALHVAKRDEWDGIFDGTGEVPATEPAADASSTPARSSGASSRGSSARKTTAKRGRPARGK